MCRHDNTFLAVEKRTYSSWKGTMASISKDDEDEENLRCVEEEKRIYKGVML